MLDLLIQTDKYFYILWGIFWFGIAVINTNIYDYYNNEETANLGKVFAPDFAATVLVFFTFHWTIDSDDSKKIVVLKKCINIGTVIFSVLTIYCVGIWTYKFNKT